MVELNSRDEYAMEEGDGMKCDCWWSVQCR